MIAIDYYFVDDVGYVQYDCRWHVSHHAHEKLKIFGANDARVQRAMTRKCYSRVRGFLA